MPGRVVGATAVSWPWPPAVSQAQGGVSWALQRRVAARCAAPLAAVCWAVSRYIPASSLQYTICIATQFQPNQPPQSRYNFCIVTLPSQPTACNTIFVLQHTSNSPCNTIPVAIKFCIATHPSLFLQYNPAF